MFDNFFGVFIYSPVNMTINTAIPRVYIAILRDRDTLMYTVCLYIYFKQLGSSFVEIEEMVLLNRI